MAERKAGAKKEKASGAAKPKKTAARRPAKAVKSPSKTSRKPAAKRAAPRKEAAAEVSRYGCEDCGLVVSIDEWGDMNIVNLVCCGKQMQPA